MMLKLSVCRGLYMENSKKQECTEVNNILKQNHYFATLYLFDTDKWREHPCENAKLTSMETAG